MKTILAVAIGKSGNSRIIKDANPASLNGTRPYIRGLINWLANQPDPPTPYDTPKTFTIGETNDYIIDYRECDENDLQKTFSAADIVLCLSTTVARGAVKYGYKTPIVAIVSDPFIEKFPGNVCGVSAQRPAHAQACYKQFKRKKKKMKNVYALHKEGYDPSTIAKGWLGKQVIPVSVNKDDDIKDIITNKIPRDADGLLILPADRFFGAADDIVQAADVGRKLPTFWSVPDWPTNSFGGCGFPQETCGQYLAERIAQIWTNYAIPDPPFELVDESEIKSRP